MRSLERRIADLESADRARRGLDKLVLIAPHGRLTNEQQAAVDAARRDGRELFVVAIVARHEPLPVAARPSYRRRQ
ncbi:hypothetical protein [Azohydromonas sp.]|uniref:hypothetical protein n=1 Tax=Azohydromonas sp. TaxID=1872666 RepID=UPI002BA241A7|nr:hypothetical protein [Azohydromonas sp.]HMM87064.1 hypothetical protein [Azohydromonas sp.]